MNEWTFSDWLQGSLFLAMILSLLCTILPWFFAMFYEAVCLLIENIEYRDMGPKKKKTG